jgi:hypothetical protein
MFAAVKSALTLAVIGSERLGAAAELAGGSPITS